MLSLDCIVQRNPSIFATEANRDLVMVSIPAGFYYSLSDVGREIWQAIERPKKISVLIDDLATTYRIDRPSCTEQTLSFLDELLAQGLLEVRDGPIS